MWGWVLKVEITRLPSERDTLPFASSWATSVHFLVQTAGCDLNHSNISGAGILGHWQTSDYVWNRLYLTLIHSYVRASDPLNRTYSKLRVFRINMFLAAPSFHQPMTATLLFVAILRVSKEDKTRHLTDGKLSPPQSLNCASKLRFMTQLASKRAWYPTLSQSKDSACNWIKKHKSQW